MSENWLPVIVGGVLTRYSVSDLGRILGVKGQILQPILSASGYHRVTLYIDKLQTSHSVHRLVAIAHLGVAPELNMAVHHKDWNTVNNKVTNLEWATRLYNNQHRQPRQGPRNSGLPVVKYNIETKEELARYPSANAAPAGEHGVSRACRGLIPHYAGFGWKYYYEQLPEEEWKQVSLNGVRIEVSNCGRVKHGNRITSGSRSGGYQHITIAGMSYRVHRLVLSAFKPIDNPDLYVVNHVDKNRANNSLENLEWCTQQENMQKSAAVAGNAIKSVIFDCKACGKQCIRKPTAREVPIYCSNLCSNRGTGKERGVVLRHGTLSMYNGRKCRCELCTTACRETAKAYRIECLEGKRVRKKRASAKDEKALL